MVKRRRRTRAEMRALGLCWRCWRRESFGREMCEPCRIDYRLTRKVVPMWFQMRRKKVRKQYAAAVLTALEAGKPIPKPPRIDVTTPSTHYHPRRIYPHRKPNPLRDRKYRYQPSLRQLVGRGLACYWPPRPQDVEQRSTS